MRIELCELMRSPTVLADALGARLIGERPVTPLGLTNDSREVLPGDLFLALPGASSHGADFIADAARRGAVGVIAKEGIRVPEACLLFAVKDPITALLSAAAFRRRRSRAYLVAVSGSVGKTTVKEGVATLLSSVGSVAFSQGNFNSQIGFPLSMLSFAESDFWVVELGINHPGEMQAMASAAMPDLALLTGVGNAHIGHFESDAELLSEKLKIATCLRGNGVFLLPAALKTAASFGQAVRVLGMGQGGDFYLDKIDMSPKGVCGDLMTPDRVITNVAWPVPGRIGVCAITAIGAAGALIGCSAQTIRQGLLLAGERTPRMQALAVEGRVLIDDSYNASPDAVEGALEVLSYRAGGRPTVAVLGDMLELGERSQELHFRVGAAVARSGVSQLFTYGEQAACFASGALDAGMDAKCIFCFARQEKTALVKALLRDTPPNAVMLLKGSGRMKMYEIVEEIRRKI
ncbi:MAG: UDP-N-acetylmuramoyl-tripeptide--D-alanyl-D-alanine ligase [Ruminococcaceae bacterium]|nr:UDP-N-acetylmuramoyl-tripeptide--D-alanyl-D-alanine ligase [Oscillospiraceae bacterium]